MDMAHGSHEERLAAAHATLRDGVASLTSSEDWQNLLKMAGSFHRYSPNNQMLLAIQGADGLVASFQTWKRVTAEDGQPCRIRKGETALRVFAPIRAKRQEVDPETGLPAEPTIVGYKLVPVFCQTQLVSPPDLPAQPKLLAGEEPRSELWDAVANQIYAAGFTLRRGPIEGVPDAKGITKFAERTVIVRDDLTPSQALKTQIHELAHVLMHDPSVAESSGAVRDRAEVEAESVAYVVCDLLGVDSAEYSIPYVASWAAGDPERTQATAQSVLATARKIVGGIEDELGVELRPNPIADALAATNDRPAEASKPARTVAPGSADRIIFEHLAAGDVDWFRVATSLPGCDHGDEAIRKLADRPAGQAVLLAEAGASAAATVAVLRAEGVDDVDLRRHLSAVRVDALGERAPLYHPDEVKEALATPRHVKQVADELVADLLVSTGKHPAAVLHLAKTSDQPSNVINLVEERLRRRAHPVFAGADRRAERGLSLIDEWTGKRPEAPSQSGGPGPSGPEPDPPPPPEPAA